MEPSGGFKRTINRYIWSMKVPFWKNTIVLFFLSAFLLLRIANVHAISHSLSDDDLQSCELCKLIAASDEATSLNTNLVAVIIPANHLQIYTHKSGFHYYSIPEIKKFQFTYFHNRPPPDISL